MLKVSAVIITLNEGKNLSRCLDSLKNLVDEILVIDSFSQDNTVHVAEQFRAKVFQKKFEGFGSQKQFAIEQAQYDWILSIDADEELSQDLKQSITLIKNNGPKFDAYKCSRLNNYCGKWIRHCGWYPDFQIRLFDRRKGHWKQSKVHETWQQHQPQTAIGFLAGDLLHYTYSSVPQHVSQIQKFAYLAALDAVGKNKTASLWKIIFVPKWIFFQKYIFQLGILDGYYGYIICKLTAHAKWLRYNLTRIENKK